MFIERGCRVSIREDVEWIKRIEDVERGCRVSINRIVDDPG